MKIIKVIKPFHYSLYKVILLESEDSNNIVEKY